MRFPSLRFYDVLFVNDVLKVVASSFENKKVGDFSEQSNQCVSSVFGAY